MIGCSCEPGSSSLNKSGKTDFFGVVHTCTKPYTCLFLSLYSVRIMKHCNRCMYVHDCTATVSVRCADTYDAMLCGADTFDPISCAGRILTIRCCADTYDPMLILCSRCMRLQSCQLRSRLCCSEQHAHAPISSARPPHVNSSGI